VAGIIEVGVVKDIEELAAEREAVPLIARYGTSMNWLSIGY
jgi:hypothetical protein